jgi:hypothetical protein
VNGSTNPKSIPGALQLYSIQVANLGHGGADPGTLRVSDSIPASTALVITDIDGAGSGPVAFVDGAPASGLAYSFGGLASTGDALEFSSDGGATWAYTPTPDANGCDPAVTHIRVTPGGAMAAAAAGGNPSFELRFRVRVD